MRFDWVLKLYAVYLVGFFFAKNGIPELESPVPIKWWFFSLLLLLTIFLEFAFFRKVQVKEQELMSLKIELADRHLRMQESKKQVGGDAKGKKTSK